MGVRFQFRWNIHWPHGMEWNETLLKIKTRNKDAFYSTPPHLMTVVTSLCVRILWIRPRFLLLAPQWQLLDTPRDLQLQSSNDKEVCVWCQNFVGLNLTSFLPHTPGRKPCTLAKGWDVGKAFILSSTHKATLALRVALQKEWAHGPVELNKNLPAKNDQVTDQWQSARLSITTMLTTNRPVVFCPHHADIPWRRDLAVTSLHQNYLTKRHIQSSEKYWLGKNTGSATEKLSFRSKGRIFCNFQLGFPLFPTGKLIRPGQYFSEDWIYDVIICNCNNCEINCN
jgi:hypothetical protein